MKFLRFESACTEIDLFTSGECVWNRRCSEDDSQEIVQVDCKTVIGPSLFAPLKQRAHSDDNIRFPTHRTSKKLFSAENFLRSSSLAVCN